MKKNAMTKKEIMKQASKQGRKDGKNQVPRQEWGQSNASWVSFLTGFSSEKVYRKNVNDFCCFMRMNNQAAMILA